MLGVHASSAGLSRARLGLAPAGSLPSSRRAALSSAPALPGTCAATTVSEPPAISSAHRARAQRRPRTLPDHGRHENLSMFWLSGVCVIDPSCGTATDAHRSSIEHLWCSACDVRSTPSHIRSGGEHYGASSRLNYLHVEWQMHEGIALAAVGIQQSSVSFADKITGPTIGGPPPIMSGGGSAIVSGMPDQLRDRNGGVQSCHTFLTVCKHELLKYARGRAESAVLRTS